MEELLRWCFYASFICIAGIAMSNRQLYRAVQAAWHLLGLALSLSALLAVCGGLRLQFAIAYSSSPAVSASGARLAGLLEYPNTFGAVMAVFLLERLFAVAEEWGGRAGGAVRGGKAQGGGTGKGVGNTDAGQGAGSKSAGQHLSRSSVQESGVRSSGQGAGSKSAGQHLSRSSVQEAGVRSSRQGAWSSGAEQGIESSSVVQGAGSRSAVLLRSLPLFPYAAALLLSESRGAWLAAAAAAAAVLLAKRRLIAPLVATGAAPAAAAALLYRQLARAGLAVEPLPGLLALAGCWAGALLAGLWLCRRCQRSAAGSARAALAAALCWTAAGTAVLQQVYARIAGPSPTASARGLFYRDAWQLAAEAPWLGQGGGTWRSAYLAVQSRPYVGSQVHSGYLDLLLNLGVSGVAAAGLLLLAALWLVSASPRLLAPALVILLHSAVDFDWSYGLVWLLLLGLAAAGAAKLQHGQTILPPRKRSSGWRIADHLRIFAAYGVCLLLSLLCLRAETAQQLYTRALQASHQAESTAWLRQSLDWNPLLPQTATALARLLPAEESLVVLQRGLEYSPQNAALSWEMARQLWQGEQPGPALYWVRRSLQLDRYNVQKHLAAIEGMLGMAERKRAEGEERAAMNAAAAGTELLRQYRLLAVEEGRRGKQHNDRYFGDREEAVSLHRRLVVFLEV
ncbi:hypothetical protein B9T62_27355 [Paenibacillus donghaensis]|uniref:O-antigen ligase-related domain-containing protein n=2 Tax=Paenibacillus donghaensis TaxID=414771 RepID=A0A2Z2KKD8_9BACL|nr:hypothetical protein B9T62_27355 [Paenibacillus donghaensis]